MTDFDDYTKEKQKIEDKYKQDLIELKNKYKIYASRQISNLEEEAIKLKRNRVKEKEIMKLLNLTKWELYKLTCHTEWKKLLYEDIIKDCSVGLSITELAKKYNYSKQQITLITTNTRNVKTKKEIEETKEKIKKLAKIGLNKKTISLVTNSKDSFVNSVLKKINNNT